MIKLWSYINIWFTLFNYISYKHTLGFLIEYKRNMTPYLCFAVTYASGVLVKFHALFLFKTQNTFFQYSVISQYSYLTIKWQIFKFLYFVFKKSHQCNANPSADNDLFWQKSVSFADKGKSLRLVWSDILTFL